MNLPDALVARLDADAGVTAIFGDRIALLTREQGGALPALVLTIVSDVRRQHLQGFEDMREARVQLSSFSNDYLEGRSGIEAAIGALVSPAEVTDPAGSDVIFWRSGADGPRDLGDQGDEGFVFHAQADLTIRYGLA